MTNLQKAKTVIKEHIHEARCGIYDCRNIAGDSMTTIYNDGNLIIDICYGWKYFEVFGLTDDVSERYWDIIIYDRELTEKEMFDYDLDYLGES